jgi:hypothetical protein
MTMETTRKEQGLRALRRGGWASLALVIACGGAQTPSTGPTYDSPSRDRQAEVDDGMTIEGIHATLRRDEVDPVLNQAAPRFQRCFAEAYEDHPYLAGDIAFHFVVTSRGGVRSVQVTSATLGSTELQDCIINVARGLRFPEPHGAGDAEFDYGPLVMRSDDGRPADLWTPDQLEEQLADEDNQEALRQCTEGASGFHATLYIGPGGRVRTLAVLPPAPEQAEQANCLAEALRAWQFPDPGDWVAKVSLEM